MMYGRGFGYGNNMMGGWLGGWMLLFGAVVVVGIVLLIIWAVRASSGHGTSGTATPPSATAAHDEAVAIARRRLASGEITKDEYDHIMGALGG